MYVFVSNSAVAAVFQKDVVPWSLRLGNRIATNATRRCNVDTGRLRSSIHAEVDELAVLGVGVKVGSNVSYAIYVHEGTGPHIIRPRHRRFLRFPGRTGGMVFARQVHHPGYRGNPFLRDAMVEEVARL